MFRSSNVYEELVNKTTSELLTTENWELIMEVCDRVGTKESDANECFHVINKRMLHRNANVVLYTLSLIEAMLKNCGQNVKQEVSSRAFTTTLTRVLNDKTVHDSVKKRILGDIQQWAFEFRQDPTLSLMEETYTKLRAQRFRFPSPQKPDKVPKQTELDRQKEEDDLQLALALSLSSVNKTGSKANYQSPAAIRSEITRQQTMISTGGPVRRTVSRTSAHSSKRVQVKALFDFNPTEAGELGFFKGDVIDVLDQKYRDWWKGTVRGKSGIFPANFVQPLTDIRAEITKGVDDEVEVFSEAHNIEALLRMLGTVDPMKSNVSDNEEVQKLYSSTLALRPKIIKLIEKYTKKKEELMQLDSQFSNAMHLYDDLMQRSTTQSGQYNGMPPPQGQNQGLVQPPQPGQSGQPGQIQMQSPHLGQGQAQIQPQGHISAQPQIPGGGYNGSQSAYDLRPQGPAAQPQGAISYSYQSLPQTSQQPPQQQAVYNTIQQPQQQQPQGAYAQAYPGSQAPASSSIHQPIMYYQPQQQSTAQVQQQPQQSQQPQFSQYPVQHYQQPPTSQGPGYN